MIIYTDGKPMAAPSVLVYACRRCSYVARLDHEVAISNRCPRCRQEGRMRCVRADTAGEIADYLDTPEAEWEDFTEGVGPGG